MLKCYFHKINPGAFIKKIESDGYCVVRTFLEGLLLCYNYEIQLKDTIKNFRSEIHTNHKNYSDFSPDDVNILTELDLFLTNPLKYYNAGTVGLLLVALGKSYTCKLLFITVKVSQNRQPICVILPKVTIKPYILQKQICHI